MEHFDAAGRKYVVTFYAARRMALREITVADLKEVLGHLMSIDPSSRDPNRLVCRRTVGGRRLNIVIEGIRGQELWEVVTAWVRGQDE